MKLHVIYNKFQLQKCLNLLFCYSASSNLLLKRNLIPEISIFIQNFPLKSLDWFRHIIPTSMDFCSDVIIAIKCKCKIVLLKVH